MFIPLIVLSTAAFASCHTTVHEFLVHEYATRITAVFANSSREALLYSPITLIQSAALLSTLQNQSDDERFLTYEFVKTPNSTLAWKDGESNFITRNLAIFDENILGKETSLDTSVVNADLLDLNLFKKESNDILLTHLKEKIETSTDNMVDSAVVYDKVDPDTTSILLSTNRLIAKFENKFTLSCNSSSGTENAEKQLCKINSHSSVRSYNDGNINAIGIPLEGNGTLVFARGTNKENFVLRTFFKKAIIITKSFSLPVVTVNVSFSSLETREITKADVLLYRFSGEKKENVEMRHSAVFKIDKNGIDAASVTLTTVSSEGTQNPNTASSSRDNSFLRNNLFDTLFYVVDNNYEVLFAGMMKEQPL